MLAQVLALAVAIGSILIYLAAFLFPEIHRKNDFIWSGVGLFYGLVLWIFARRITGGLLLGHVASVALLGWFGWQTMSLRRQVVPKAQQTPIPTPTSAETLIDEETQVTKVSSGNPVSGLLKGLGGIFAGKKKSAATETKPTETTTLDKAAIDAIADDNDDTVESEETDSATTTEAVVDTISSEVTETTTVEADTETEATPPNSPAAELEATAQPETEVKEPTPVEEIAPDAELAPPAEPPTEEKPPSTGEG